VIDRSKFNPAIGLRKGAYILADPTPDKPEIILIATGSEIHLALEAYEKLRAEGIRARIVNMPSWELFEQQPEDYRYEILSPDIKARISIEAGSTHGWHKYVGLEGETIGIDRFGASAPGKILLQKFGFTLENLLNRVRTLLAKNQR
jgi:transketolase